MCRELEAKEEHARVDHASHVLVPCSKFLEFRTWGSGD